MMSEFEKRIDPDLSFSGHQTRYRVFALPSFNEPSAGGIERLDKVWFSRRGDPGFFVANRASLPQRNQLTVRATFELPPVAAP